MASVRPNAGSTGDLLRLRVMDPMDMESGGGVNPTLARSFPAKKGGASVRASAILAMLLLCFVCGSVSYYPCYTL